MMNFLIRAWEENDLGPEVYWRSADFIIEASCPPKRLLSIRSERLLTFEVEADKELYILYEYTIQCQQVSGLAGMNAGNRSRLIGNYKQPYMPLFSEKIPPPQSTIKLPTFGSLSSRPGLPEEHRTVHTALEDVKNNRNIEYRVSSIDANSCQVTFMVILPPTMIILLRYTPELSADISFL